VSDRRKYIRAEALRMQAGEFWKNWSIVTGIPVPSNIAEKCGFVCGC
jgi:hypothetical protein